MTVTLTINSFDGRPYMALLMGLLNLIGLFDDVPGVDELLSPTAHNPLAHHNW
jgi:hypothetical protein